MRTSRRLRGGIVLTFAAVALVALAAASAWWPSDGDSGNRLAVRASTGQTLCGTPTEGRAGALTLAVEEGRIAVPIQSIAAVGPVSTCP